MKASRLAGSLFTTKNQAEDSVKTISWDTVSQVRFVNPFTLGRSNYKWLLIEARFKGISRTGLTSAFQILLISLGIFLIAEIIHGHAYLTITTVFPEESRQYWNSKLSDDIMLSRVIAGLFFFLGIIRLIWVVLPIKRHARKRFILSFGDNSEKNNRISESVMEEITKHIPSEEAQTFNFET